VVFLQSAYQRINAHLAKDTTREHATAPGLRHQTNARNPANYPDSESVTGRHSVGKPRQTHLFGETWIGFQRQSDELERLASACAGWVGTTLILVSNFLISVGPGCVFEFQRRFHVALVVDPVSAARRLFVGAN